MEGSFNFASRKKLLKPDACAWLVPDLVSALKDLSNEFDLTLWDALREYVGYHAPHCPFQGPAYEGELFLYPILEYNPQNRRAELKKLFFVSEDVKTIFMHDYLRTHQSSRNNTPFVGLLRRSPVDKFEDFPGLEFVVAQNNMETSLAKEMLLKFSFYRRSIKKSFIMENVSAGIYYKSTNIVTIDFDLSFLEHCSFLKAKRYASFKKILPENLIISIGCRLEFDLPDIPKDLKQQQLISIGSLSQ